MQLIIVAACCAFVSLVGYTVHADTAGRSDLSCPHAQQLSRQTRGAFRQRCAEVFSAYAPAQAWGPKVVVGSHVGSVPFDITATAIGDASIVGEVEYYDAGKAKRRTQFRDAIKFRTGDVAANVRVRFKSIGVTGTSVRVRVSS